MAEIASMRFQSAQRPDESGTVKLTDDGYIKVEPSEAMIETIAKLEIDAVDRATRNSVVVSTLLFVFGALIAILGWAAARQGGKLREKITDARQLSETTLQYDPKHGVNLEFHDNPLRRTSLSWAPGEYNADEAEKLYDSYKSLKGG